MKSCKHPTCHDECRREKKAKKYTPIPKVSDKRKKENERYKLKMIAFLKANPSCQVKGCFRYSDDVHHKAGRVGDNFLNVSTWMAVCRAHHAYIETHPVWAKENGYSLSRLIECPPDEQKAA